MKDLNFPLFKTRVADSRRFNLNDPEERREYFMLKAGPEVEKIREYLKTKSFVAFLLGKKNSGKGTYSKLFMEIVGGDKAWHLSVGDLVRDIHKMIESKEGEAELVNFLKENYRGFHSVEETIELIEGRSTEKLMSSELIVALIKFEIAKHKTQALFIDGFPRGLDQINYALFLKEIIGYQNHPDFFVFIDVPESVIDERIKYRVVCPICNTPRSTKLLATAQAGWDEATKTFYLKCDTPECNGARLIKKEGDELGIEPIRARLETDDKIFRQLMSLQGVPKIFLRNSIPVEGASEYADDYELTPEYIYTLETDGSVAISEKPWLINDDNGISSYSLLPPAIVVSLIKQVAGVLGL